MAKAYIGADNVAKLVKKMYIGVDGVARKVTKAYYGVNGVAKLVYSGEKEYLYGGTSTFVYGVGQFVSSKTDYVLADDVFLLQVEKYDTVPLYVYIDGELVATQTDKGEYTVTLNGFADTIMSKGTLTVTIASESAYGLGEQDFYQIWNYNGTNSKNAGTSTMTYAFMSSATLSDNVIKIWNYPFNRLRDSDLLSVPSKGLITIGDNALRCGLTLTESAEPLLDLKSFTIPQTVTSIGNSAFYFSSNLKSIVIPRSVTSIGNSAFTLSGVTDITFKHGATDQLSIAIDTSEPSNSAFHYASGETIATNVYHNGNPSVLNYNWALCGRTVTFIQE